MPRTLSEYQVAMFIAVRVSLPQKGDIDIMSAYFQDGQKLGPENQQLLELIFRTADDTQLVIGADWNMSPEVLEGSDAPEQLRTSVVSTAKNSPTCRTSHGKFNRIDYFLVSSALAGAVNKIEAEEKIEFRPHRPVEVSWHKGFVDIWVETFVKATPLGRDIICGATPAPRNREVGSAQVTSRAGSRSQRV